MIRSKGHRLNGQLIMITFADVPAAAAVHKRGNAHMCPYMKTRFVKALEEAIPSMTKVEGLW